MELNQVNDKTPEGRLLMMALAALSVSPEIQIGDSILKGTMFTPMNLLARLEKVAEEVYKDQPVDPFRAAADPLIKYLCENHHPHVTAIVTGTGAELMEGLKSTGKIMDYVRD